MNEITEGKFPEVRSRQEMYLQDIIKSLSNESISDNNYPDPLSRQEAYLQIIISKLRANDPNIEINTEDIEKAVNKYLEQNPIQPGATENQAQQIEENKKDVGSLKEDLSKYQSIITEKDTSINLYDSTKVVDDKAMQASGLIAGASGLAYIELTVPYRYAVVFTGMTNNGNRDIVQYNRLSHIIKGYCVKETDGTVLESQGKNSQSSIYWNKDTNSAKNVTITFTKNTQDLMIEIIPIEQYNGIDNDWATYMASVGINEYVPFYVDYELLGNKIKNASIGKEKLNFEIPNPLKQSISWYKNKKIVTFGDSITEHETWQGHLKDYFDCVFQNCGIGGTTVALSNLSNYQNNCMYQDSRINAIDNDADVIIVWGGNNDFGATYNGITLGEIVPWWKLSDEGDSSKNLTVSNFTYAYALMLKKIVTRFPNAKIFTVTCIGGRNSDGISNSDIEFYMNGYFMRDFSNQIKKISELYGIPCIDVGGLSRLNTFTHTSFFKANDVIHPNAEGGKLIANLMINELKRFEPIDFQNSYNPKY